MNKQNKIKFIKNNIVNNYIDHQIVINFINDNYINYIINKNGIFLTINKIKTKYINELYKIINNYIKNSKNIQKDIELHNINVNNEKKIIRDTNNKSSKNTDIQYEEIDYIVSDIDKLFINSSLN